MKKRRTHSILLLLMLIIMTFKTFSTNAQSTEISVINDKTENNNFTFYNSTTSTGDRFNATIWVHEVVDLFAYQTYLCVNDTLLNITNAWLPTWDANWVFNGKTSLKLVPAFYDFDNDSISECVKIADSLLPISSTFTGSGLLAIIEFEILYTAGNVSCTLDIDNIDTSLLNYDLIEISTIKTSGYYEYILLPPGSSTIILKVLPAYVIFGEDVNITGLIDPSKPDVTVTIQYKLNTTEGTWWNLTKVQTDHSSQYNYTWETSEAGTFKLKALWEGDNMTSGAESLIAILKVLYASTISIDVSPTNVTAFSNVTITGTIHYRNATGSWTPPVGSANITIKFRSLNETSPDWGYLNATTTNGFYTCNWEANKATKDSNETFEFLAQWSGNNVIFGNQSQIKTIMIWKTILHLTISVSHQEVPTGSNVTITGTVTPAKANLDIRIGKSDVPDPSQFSESIVEGTTDINGSYNCVWSIDLGLKGEWWLKPYYTFYDAKPNVYRTNLSKIEPAFINITRMSSSIIITVDPLTVSVGSSVIINGTLNPPKPNEAINIFYRRDGGLWIKLDSFTKTDAEGHFNLTWEELKGGSYDVYAKWGGDLNTEEAKSSNVTLAVLRKDSNLTIDISPETITLESNSTITGTLTPAQTLVDVTIYYKNA
ncbi:hypothetical protein KAU55_04050, partial [Candidatus Bathyarchaeota archaeon]|nr:hypothetical protein [Candidatus Bathyarchaeota archaeon]